jgi:hypothetical protein
MLNGSHLRTIKEDSQVAAVRIAEGLARVGFPVVRSFDLQAARSAHTHCACPHHGEAQCDCQMVVLLVYSPSVEGQPVTLVLHGRDGRTELAAVNNPDRQAGLEILVLQALNSL